MRTEQRESLILYFRNPGPQLSEAFGTGDPPDRAFEHISGIHRRFADSPEGQALGEVRFTEMFLEHAHLYYDADETSLTPEMVRDIVLELFPRHVTVPATEASRIISELQLFFVHLANELGSSVYFACAHALDDPADKQLAERLADPARFGAMKNAVMSGLDEGYDVNTVDGLQAWFERLESREHRRFS